MRLAEERYEETVICSRSHNSGTWHRSFGPESSILSLLPEEERGGGKREEEEEEELREKR